MLANDSFFLLKTKQKNFKKQKRKEKCIMKKMNISKRIKKAMVTMAITAMAAMTVPTITFAAETDGSKSGRLPAGQEEPAHYHQPGWIAKEPTCTEPGLMQDICPYHPDYVWSEEEIPALGHDMGEWVIIKEATYDEEGLKVRDCSRGDLHEEEVIPKLEKEPEDEPSSEEPVHEHAFGDWTETTAPTCTKTGEATRVCDCGETETKVIPALGHKMGAWTVTKEATCTENGVETRKCDRCGHTETREIKAHGHKEATVNGYDATCTTNGLTNGTVCSECGEVLAAQEVIPALGHDYGEWTVVKAPEIGVEGIEEHVCSRCGHKEQRTIPALTDDDDEVTPDDDDNTPDVLSEYIPEDEDDDNDDDIVNNDPDVLSEYIPQTGDTSNILLYVLLMLGALLVLVAATRKEEQ